MRTGLTALLTVTLLAGCTLPATAPTPTPTKTPTANSGAGQPTTTAPTPAVKAPRGFSDGDTPAEVGPDIPPGTYRVDAKVTADQHCYWMKSKDAEGSEILENALPQGGRPQVTLKKGTWFTSQSCGHWVAVA